jgi:hypothetical protein
MSKAFISKALASSLRRDMALIALLFGMMVTALPRPVYAQEVDPSWFEPTPAASSEAAAQSAQPNAAQAKKEAKAKQAASEQRVAKVRVKRATKQS